MECAKQARVILDKLCDGCDNEPKSAVMLTGAFKTQDQAKSSLTKWSGGSHWIGSSSGVGLILAQPMAKESNECSNVP